MTGLSVLYAKEAASEPEWAAVPAGARPGRLREVYWARRAESNRSSKHFFNAGLSWRPDRTEIGRRRDDPGDGFVYLVDLISRPQDRFEWLEVTEVFTTVPARQIEGAMRAWNGIPDRHPVDFCKFRRGVSRGRPSRISQRQAADDVVAQIERKLSKASYQELLEKYGYGTLVVGMPLWFATPPDDPRRAENAVDDFATRTILGLQEIRRGVLKRRECPFRRVIVTWDTTPQALREWRHRRSAEYENPANVSLKNPAGAPAWGRMSELMEEATSKAGVPESDAPSMRFYVDAQVRKEASGTGPYPERVEGIREALREKDENLVGLGVMLKLKIAGTLLGWRWFLSLHGMKGFKSWIARKVSVPHAWRARTTRRRARRLYRESRHRGREFGRS